MWLETPRLVLREMTVDDFGALYDILSDAHTMAHYPAPFDEAKVRRWIAWNRDNYATFGFGLWAVTLKEDGRLIGDCGLTMQHINGVIKPEIGYHIHRAEQCRGYATEAAAKCIDYTFGHTPFGRVYAYMKHTSIASMRVAEHIGMQLVDTYQDPINTQTNVYALPREAWAGRMNT